MLKSVDDELLSGGTPGSLYQRVLGAEAIQLHPQVAVLHCGKGSVRAWGWMRVDRGAGLMARLTAILLRLPKPGDRVRVRLTIVRHHGDERWFREFGDRAAICSRQSGGRAGELVERFGVIAFVFTLEVVGEVLRFRQRACQVRLGRLALTIPPAFAPRVEAEVAPPATSGLAVSVRIDHPWLGRLLAYQGVVDMDEGPR